MGLNKLIQERSALKREKKLIEKKLAKKIAEAEHVNDEKIVDKKQRDKIKAKKLNDDPYNSERLKELNAEIEKANKDLKRIKKSNNQRRTKVEKLGNQISNLSKRIFKKRRPKIIVLDLDFRAMSTQGSIDKVIGHYTAGPRDKDTKDAIRLCKIYHQAHLNNGWSGEGYALCFTSDGNILVLRPAKYVGAHTLGYNTGSIGIMVHGTTGDKATEAQKKALRWWSENGHKSVMKSGQIKAKPKNLKWYGHNDFNPTSCPGSFKETYISKGKD
jgi:hypothetical protein